MQGQEWSTVEERKDLVEVKGFRDALRECKGGGRREAEEEETWMQLRD